MLTACLIAIPVAYADDSQRHQRISGMDIYLGVMPSQLVLSKYPEMHTINNPSRHIYHVLIALFDSKTGDRIKGATVIANVSPSAASATANKKLEVMKTYGAISYGNFFNMNTPGQYRITVDIQHSRIAETAVANFIYQRPED